MNVFIFDLFLIKMNETKEYYHDVMHRQEFSNASRLVTIRRSLFVDLNTLEQVRLAQPKKEDEDLPDLTN